MKILIEKYKYLFNDKYFNDNIKKYFLKEVTRTIKL